MDLRLRIQALRRRELPPEGFFSGLSPALREAVPFDAAAMLTCDPETTLPAGGVVEGFPEWLCGPFWDNELQAEDFNKFTVLARDRDPVAALSETTGGELSRSARYERLYRPLDYGDECRCVLRVGASTWGYLALARDGAGGPFTPAEVRRVRDVVHEIAAGVRESVIRSPRLGRERAPAVVILTARDAIESRSEGADDWLEELGGGAVPNVVRIAAAWARAGRRDQTPLRVRGEAGRWCIVEAATLVRTGGKVAVTIRPALTGELLPILLEGHGLTERETEIVLELARGKVTKEIAARLCISTHTVRDHVKAIFEKVGVNSRGELVATLYAVTRS
jgi:DNA-binding CsgD family transcriptional regulator